MECPVCFTFDDEPKRLACTHTFCITCIKGILVSTGGKYKVTCPICKRKCNIPGGDVSKLPTNSLYHKLQQHSEGYDIIKDEFVTCHSCKQSRSVVNIKYCKDCNWDLCIICSIKHTDKPVFHDHVIDSKSTIICRRHSCQFNFYCTFCDKLLCPMCVQESICEGHNIKSLREVYIPKSDELMNLISKLEDVSNEKSKYYPDDAKKAITLAGETKEVIKQHVHHLNGLVNSRENDLIQRLCTFEDVCNLYIQQVQSKNHENQFSKELIISANEAIKKGMEELVMMVTLIKSSNILTKEIVFPFNWSFKNTYLKFEAQDSLNVGYISMLDTATGRKTHSDFDATADKSVQATLNIPPNPDTINSMLCSGRWVETFNGSSSTLTLQFIDSEKRNYEISLKRKLPKDLDDEPMAVIVFIMLFAVFGLYCISGDNIMSILFTQNNCTDIRIFPNGYAVLCEGHAQLHYSNGSFIACASNICAESKLKDGSPRRQALLTTYPIVESMLMSIIERMMKLTTHSTMSNIVYDNRNNYVIILIKQMKENTDYALFLSTENLAYIDRVSWNKGINVTSFDVLRNGQMVVATLEEIRMYSKVINDNPVINKCTLQFKITHYGNKNQYKTEKVHKVLVAHNNMIVVSIPHNNHVVYFDSTGKFLYLVEIGSPSGLCHGPNGSIIVASRWTNGLRVYMLGQEDLHIDVILQVFIKSHRDELNDGHTVPVALDGNTLLVIISGKIYHYEMFLL